MRQQSLFDKQTKQRYGRTEYGGVKTRGHRKLERPFRPNKWTHLVLKSDKAFGRLSFLLPKNKRFIQRLLERKSKEFGVEIGDFVNVGNHLHIKLRANVRRQMQRFLRSVSGRIAREVTGARRGKRFGRFWQGLAYTRVLTSGLEELRLRGYFQANREEAASGKARREEFLEKFNLWVRHERARAKGKAPPRGPVLTPDWA